MMAQQTGLHAPDYFILVGYFVLMLGIGAYFWRHMKGMRDYFSGRNQIPWWLSGVSYYMTSFTAFLFVAYSELAFRHGLVAVTLGWMVVPAVLIGVLFFAGRWRRARMDSPVEYLEERYGLALRQTFGWANIPIRMVDNGLRLYATGMFVAGVVGMDVQRSILYTGLITLAYTFAGGLWAVTATDFVQFVVMMAGALMLVPLSLAKVGGLTALLEHAPPGFWRPLAGPFTWHYLVGWFLLLVCNYNTSFGLVQRYYCVRDEREARKTGLLVAALCIVGTPIFFLPAMAARQFMPDASPKDIYATLCAVLLPTGSVGLIIAAMFSATMSSLSGDYNAVACVLTNDVYKRLIDRQASQRRLVFIGRLATFLIGLVPVAIALYVARVIGTDILFRKMVTLFSIAAPPIAIPMLAGLVWPRCTNTGALAGFAAGIGTGVVLFLAGLPEQQIAMTTAAVTVVNMWVVSRLDRLDDQEQDRIEGFARKLRTPLPPPSLDDRSAVPSPWGVVGVCTAIIGAMLLATLVRGVWDAGAGVSLIMGLGLLAAGLVMSAQARRSS